MATFVERGSNWAAGLGAGTRVTVELDEKVNTVNPRGFITLHAPGVAPLKGDFVGRGSRADLVEALLPWAELSDDDDDGADEDDFEDDDDDFGRDADGDGEFRTRRFTVRVK